jgi:hypothetical protein
VFVLCYTPAVSGEICIVYHLSIVLNISYKFVTQIGAYQVSTESPLSHLKLPQASKVNETPITSHNYIIIEISKKEKENKSQKIK